MHRVVIRGPKAEVRRSYQCAATLGPWEVSARHDGGTLTAQVVSSDAFRLSQPALTFVVPRQSTAWKWPIVSLRIAGQTLTAELGPQEESDGSVSLRTAGDGQAVAG